MRSRLGTVIAALLALAVAGARAEDAKERPAKPITGQCHCGRVKFRAEGPVVKCSTCDCRGCQRATGTLKAPFVTVLRSAFTITEGEPASFRSASKAKCDCHGVWHFCPKCGTQIFWKADKGNELDIFAGTLDDTSMFRAKD